MPRQVAPVGVFGNAFPLGVGVTANENGGIVDTFSSPFVSAFGHANVACTITLFVSQDQVHWSAVATQVLAGLGDFCINSTCAGRYFALQSTAGLDATSHGTIAATGAGA